MSPNGDFVGQKLLGVRVYANDEDLIDVMKENGVRPTSAEIPRQSAQGCSPTQPER